LCWRSLRIFPGKWLESAPDERTWSQWTNFDKMKLKKILMKTKRKKILILILCFFFTLDFILFLIYTTFRIGTASSGIKHKLNCQIVKNKCLQVWNTPIVNSQITKNNIQLD
jgi:hypothetical protein